jgi:hypothetical protein
MEIKKIAYGKYEITKNNNKANIEFSRNGRYDTFDGKYHPAWKFIYNGKVTVCMSKEQAIAIAEMNL